MTQILRHPAKVGLLLALLVGLIGAQGNGCHQVAMELWVDLQAQLDSQQQQLDSQQDQICALYEVSALDSPPECIEVPDCPEPPCDVCSPAGCKAGDCICGLDFPFDPGLGIEDDRHDDDDDD